MYVWRRGWRYVVALWLINTARVPVTITGAERPGSYWQGLFTGPTLGITDDHAPHQY
jgi:hypothetical protein